MKEAGTMASVTLHSLSNGKTYRFYAVAVNDARGPQRLFGTLCRSMSLRWGPAPEPASSRRRCAALLAASWPRPTRRGMAPCKP